MQIMMPRPPLTLAFLAAVSLASIALMYHRRRRARKQRTSRPVQFGKLCRCTFGASDQDLLQPLYDSTNAWQEADWARMRTDLDRNGYLFIRALLPRLDVENARLATLEKLKEAGVLDDGCPLWDGVLRERCGLGCVPFLEGQNELTHSTPMLTVFEHSVLHTLFRGLFDVDTVRSFDFKWLRAMPQFSFTGAHMDWVYMGRGSSRVLTCWIPLGQNPIEMGTLAVAEGSHRLPEFSHLRATYGEMDHERVGLDGSGWFTEDPAEVVRIIGAESVRWRTADFNSGDILVFGMKTLHMSTSNVTGRVRISADTRWQPATEPADPRYVGDVAKYVTEEMAVAGAWNSGDDPRDASTAHKVTMAKLRDGWGFPVDAS